MLALMFPLVQVWFTVSGIGPIPTGLVIFGVVSGLVVLGLNYFRPSLAAHEALKDDTTAHDAFEWHISPDGISISGEKTSGRLQWTAVRRVTRDVDFYYFFVSAGNAYFLPRRALDPQTDERLYASIRAWLSGASPSSEPAR
jgi:hypothetical protein